MSNEKKIIIFTRLIKLIPLIKQTNKKIVLCHGVFDLIHPGHIRYLKSSKKHGEILLVTVIGDKFVRKGPGRPIFNEVLRAEVLSTLSIVDYVTIVPNESVIDVIKILKPDVYVKGPDNKLRKTLTPATFKNETEEQAVNSIGGKLVYADEDVIFSSSHLINKHLELYPEKTKLYLKNIRKIYNDESIIELLSTFKKKKILVIGDAIIDQYHYTLPMGKSSKEPLVVHIYRGEESFAGGILATANHLAALSENIHMITLLGRKKSFERFIKKHMRPQIKLLFFYQNRAPTIIKRRFIDELTKQKLFQISYMKDGVISSQVEDKVLHFLRSEISSFDMVIVNDYGHGLMSPKIIRIICKKAKYLALNVQANSANWGFNIVTKYPRADFICMDEHEMRLATHDKHSDLLILIKRIAKKLKSNELIVTRGSEGSISYAKGNVIIETPALSQSVVDRVGAGDAFFAISSPCAYIGMDQALVSFVGNVAGALKVQSVGNKNPIDFKELSNYITRLLK